MEVPLRQVSIVAAFLTGFVLLAAAIVLLVQLPILRYEQPVSILVAERTIQPLRTTLHERWFKIVPPLRFSVEPPLPPGVLLNPETGDVVGEPQTASSIVTPVYQRYRVACQRVWLGLNWPSITSLYLAVVPAPFQIAYLRPEVFLSPDLAFEIAPVENPVNKAQVSVFPTISIEGVFFDPLTARFYGQLPETFRRDFAVTYTVTAQNFHGVSSTQLTLRNLEIAADETITSYVPQSLTQEDLLREALEELQRERRDRFLESLNEVLAQFERSAEQQKEQLLSSGSWVLPFLFGSLVGLVPGGLFGAIFLGTTAAQISRLSNFMPLQATDPDMFNDESVGDLAQKHDNNELLRQPNRCAPTTRSEQERSTVVGFRGTDARSRATIEEAVQYEIEVGAGQVPSPFLRATTRLSDLTTAGNMPVQSVATVPCGVPSVSKCVLQKRTQSQPVIYNDPCPWTIVR